MNGNRVKFYINEPLIRQAHQELNKNFTNTQLILLEVLSSLKRKIEMLKTSDESRTTESNIYQTKTLPQWRNILRKIVSCLKFCVKGLNFLVGVRSWIDLVMWIIGLFN